MSQEVDDNSDAAVAVASANGLADPETNPPDLRGVHLLCALAFAACVFVPAVYIDRHLRLAKAIPPILALRGHPHWHDVSRVLLYAIPLLGLAAGLLCRVVSVEAWRTKLTVLAAAGMSPFVILVAALCGHVGFFALYNLINVGAYMVMAMGLVLMALAAVEYFCRDLPKVPLGSWLRITRPEYKVWTLSYTRGGLITMFAWLLWGDFIFQLMNMIFAPAMQFQLDRMQVPKQWNAWLIQTFPSSVGFFMVPIISFLSDRTRTRFGRRIPYILATMVPLCLIVCTLGFSEDIAAWVRRSSLPRHLHLSPATLVICIMAVLIVIYDFSNVFVNSVFWYLFRDVVPAKFMGRYMAAFAIMAGVSGYIYNQFFFLKVLHANTVRYVYCETGLLYLFGFGLMCFMVKEGQYPPVTDDAKGAPLLERIVLGVWTFFRECFLSHPIYFTYFLADAMFVLSGACSSYFLLLQIRGLGFDPVALKNLGIAMIVPGMLMNIPMGWLSDRMHPLRAYMLAVTVSLPFYFILYTLHDWHIGSVVLSTFTLWSVIAFMRMPLNTLGGVSSIPMLVRLYPAKQYGQFCSAAAGFRAMLMIGATIIAGPMVAWMVKAPRGDAGYRNIFLWQGTFQCLGVCLLWAVYFIWRANGAEKFKYDPEAPAAPARGFEVLPPKR